MKLPIKSLVVAGVVGTLGVATIAGTGIANAESGTTSSSDPMSSLVEKIASTFSVDKTKVQALFDQDRTDREAEREAEQAERLQALVDDGTLTATQKTAIETKIKEMKAEREADRSSMEELSDEERKTKMDEKRTELESWAEEQGIDLSDLKGVLGGGRGGPGGGPRD